MQNLRDNVLIIYIYAVLILVLYIEIFDTEIILKLYAVIEIPWGVILQPIIVIIYKIRNHPFSTKIPTI